MTQRTKIPIKVSLSMNETIKSTIHQINKMKALQLTKLEKNNVWLFIILRNSKRSTYTVHAIIKMKGSKASVFSSHSWFSSE